jgi:hypothetical protein
MAAIFTLFLTPAAYALLSGLTRARASASEALDRELRDSGA